jgi:predicted Zn-dependent protease
MPVADLQLGQKACKLCSTLLGTFPRVIFCWLIVCLFVSGPSFGQSKNAAQSFESLAKRAAEARDADHLEEAVGLYKKALALRPRWAEGWWSLGTLGYDSNSYLEAEKAFRRVVVLTPQYASAWVMLGLCQFELNHNEQAMKSLETGQSLGISRNSEMYDVMFYHVGLLYLRMERYGSALKTFQQLAHDGVRTDEVALGLGMSILMIQPTALPAENMPGHSVILGIGRAEALLAGGKFDEALQIYSTLVEQYPDYPGLHFAYGRFLLDLHKTDEAIAQLQAELRSNPNHVLSLLEIASARATENPAEAAEYAKRAVALSPRLPIGHYLLGQFYADAGNAEAAVPELELARRYLPDDPKVYFALGKAYAKLGRKEEAAKARAEFRRLQALEEKQPGPMIYGQQSQGVPREKEQPQEPR